jgi:glycosyltransferase involved in cell wall biosynthesis
VKRGPDAPGFDPARDVIFLGLGVSSVNYYRCVLPAQELGADWLGVSGEPPKLKFATGSVRGESGVIPDLLTDYKIVVVQQVRGKGWIKLIEAMREAGVKVVYEIDDYIHGIKHMKGEHGFYENFDNKVLWETEQAMKRCDAVITTTEWIKGCYSHFNKNIYVCENGLDLRRYELTKPPRPLVNIGWSGGTGHKKAVGPWLAQVAMVMQMRPNTGFVSVGEPFGRYLAKHFPERALAIPWAAIEQYPSAMTMFDIALAPAGTGGWWRGKSHLRWLEASALGIPVIANPEVYPAIEEGVTGFHAASAQEATEKMLLLVDDPELRKKVGSQARAHIRERYSIAAVAPQWLKVFEQLLD